MSSSNGHFIHSTVEGDRWDLLAYRYYGDQHKQTVLLEANRGMFVDVSRSGVPSSSPLVHVPPMILPAGLDLVIPILDETEIDETTLPPWKRSQPEYGA